VPPPHLGASAALLVRVWTEEGEPASVRFRILASTPGRPTHVVARGHGAELLLAVVRDWLDVLGSGEPDGSDDRDAPATRPGP
jgi:hypothetical protein